jgi:hypothetical protein
MKQPKPMNRQMSLSFGTAPPVRWVPTDLPQQQRGEIENALADLLITAAINRSQIHRGGNNDE